MYPNIHVLEIVPYADILDRSSSWLFATTPLVVSDLIIGNVHTPALISDHYAVECGLHCNKPPVTKQKLHYRKLKSINQDLFTCELQQKLSTINDIDSYNSVSSALLDSHAPVISSTLVLRKHKPWYNATLRHEKRKMRRLKRKRDRITDSKLRVAIQHIIAYHQKLILQ